VYTQFHLDETHLLSFLKKIYLSCHQKIIYDISFIENETHNVSNLISLAYKNLVLGGVHDVHGPAPVFQNPHMDMNNSSITCSIQGTKNVLDVG
jgi:hypothetical protein